MLQTNILLWYKFALNNMLTNLWLIIFPTTSYALLVSQISTHHGSQILYKPC